MSCQAGKYVYDDVYDQAENPLTIDDQNGYADYIKGNEKENKVVIDAPVQQINSSYYGDIDNNCDCRRNYNSRFKYRWGTDYIYFGSYQPFSSNDCPCYYDMNNCGYSQYQNTYYSPYGYFDHLGVWHGYHHWMFNPYNGYFFSYNDPYYLSNYYWNNNYYNGYYGYYGNSNNNFGWWYNNNQSWSNGSGNTSSSNVIYGHRGNNFAGSSNTTAYDHTVKNSGNNGTDDAAISNGDHQDSYGRNIGGTSSTDLFIDPANNETPVVSPSKNIREHGTTTNAGSDISANTATNTLNDKADAGDHVIATNPFDPTGVNSGRNTGTSTQQEAKTTSTTSNDQSRYTYTSDDNTNAESGRSTNSTSRQETEQRTYNTNEQRDNNSSGNSYGGHRTSTTTTTSSGGGNSNSGSGGRTTTTSRR